jgi:hypothetical protein
MTDPQKTPEVPTVTVSGPSEGHDPNPTLAKLHEQAKAELKAAEVLLVSYEHEIGREVRAVFRALVQDVKGK